MRAEVLEAWRRSIDDSVRRSFPQFQLVTKRERGEPRGLLKYEWRPRPNLSCFIAFRPLDSEAFDALIAWSVNGRFPVAAANVPQDRWDFGASSFVDWSINLVPRNGTAHWSFWNPSDELVDNPSAFAKAHVEHHCKKLTAVEADALVASAVELGIEEVRRYGIPYLEQRARAEHLGASTKSSA